MAPSLTSTFLLITILVVLLPVEAYAFGAGDIPDFAYLNDKAFRHGDIENILETLIKSAGGAALSAHSSGLLGKIGSVIQHAKGASKFTKSDIKKVYFGNWLRDYSQAMDIAGLSKLSADTLVLVVSVLGFMTFGFASEEFEVTADRLGVYLPVEHIDNPKGYAETEGDARKFHPKLRPPVDPRELEIDENTGMKKYIATENQGWDTSTAFIRRTLKACIEAGRRANGNEGADLWEAYRLLGTGLHTLEDLLAHSNWCELALRKMGHNEVFCHVGDQVIVNTPNGRAPPLVTGTFGSADFLHSLLGEAGDKLSQASVTNLSAKISNTSQDGNNSITTIKNILSKFGGGNEDKLNQGEEIKKQTKAYNFNPDDIAPPEVQKQLLDLLKWHDDILRDIIKKMEMVPGLTNLLEEFSNAMNEYIYTILAPYLGPILTQATSILNEGSKAVIDSDDQYEVFNNPKAHDPSHSQLSKDHFGLILNEPAGKIAQIVVENSVNLIVRAWGKDDNIDQVLDQILEAFHHPYYATGRSAIQSKMYDHMERWINGLGSDSRDILSLLTKESVRDHKNKRPGLDDTAEEAGYGGCGHGYKPTQKTSASAAVAGGYAASKVSNSQGRTDNSGNTNTYGSGHASQTTPAYGQSQQSHAGAGTYGSGAASQTTSAYGHGQQSHAGSDTYGSGRTSQTTPSYGQTQQQTHGASQGRTDSSNTYGHGATTGGYGTQGRENDNDAYGVPKRQENVGGYGGQHWDETPAYGGRRDETPAYGAQTHGQTAYGGQTRKDDDDDRRGAAHAYGGQTDKPSYGGNTYGQADNSRTHKSGHDHDSDDDDNKKHRQTQAQSNYGGSASGGRGGYGREKDDSDDERKSHGRNEGHGQSAYGQRQQHGQQKYGQQQQYGDQQQQQGHVHSSGYAPSYGGQQQQHGQAPSSGYAPSYGGGNDTFGAERLNPGGGRNRRDDGDSDDDKRKQHGRQHGGY